MNPNLSVQHSKGQGARHAGGPADTGKSAIVPEVVTVGETCVVFEGTRPGLLRYVTSYERHAGGAETNVAVGVLRLGHSAGWISRVGEDEFGHYLVSFFRGEGIDVSQVKIDREHPTGLFVRQRSGVGGGQNFYYRKHSAASFLSVEDIDEGYISQARVLHVTGITPSLSPSCREAVIYAMKLARKHGVKVSLDPNIRLKMWNEDDARETINEMLKYTDFLFPGIEECNLLFGSAELGHVSRKVETLGVQLVAIKLGANGAVAKKNTEEVAVEGHKVPVMDTFAAGDAFTAGFLAGYLNGWKLRESLVYANAVGALTVTVRGNVEALPTREQVEQFLGGRDSIHR
ncbi:MAG: sugar kinase [Betaproteobacteria bacterium]|nr:sugar kinase [Betaproteobacteria bacterium]